MADENILKEFLVSLGFKVDPASESRFKDSVKSATDSMKEFSVAVAAAATETLIGLNRMANNLGALHFQSQRVGASANSIKAFQLAIQQAGGTAEGASSALETLATKFRESPGWEQKLNGMGIATRDATGKARDNAEVLLDLGQKLAKMNNSQAMAEGRALGIDEKTILALRDPATIKTYQDQIALQKQLGTNLDDSSAKATAFSQEMNKLKATFDAFTSSAVGDLSEQLLPALQATNEGLREFADWFHALPPESQQAIKTIAEIGAGLALIVTNLKLIAAAKGVLSALGGSAAGGGAAAKGGIGLLGKAGWVGASGWAGWEAGSEIYRNMSDKTKDAIGGTIATVLAKFGNEDAQKALDINTGGGADATKKSSSLPPAYAALAALIARGEGDYSSVNLGAKGGYKASKADLSNMTLAQVMQAQRDGKFNAAGRYQIIKGTLAEAAAALHLRGNEKFDSALQDRIFKDYLVDQKRKDIGEYISGKSASLHKALLAASKEWASVADPRTGRSFYADRGKNIASIGASEMAAVLNSSRAQGGNTINQTTNITVHGTETPRETAQAVSVAQNDVNANLVRNSLPVVR